MCNSHLQELQEQHSKESAQLRAYYDGITTRNLDSIQQLRKELAEMTRKEASASRALAHVTAENRGLHEPLAQVGPPPHAPPRQPNGHLPLCPPECLCTYAWSSACVQMPCSVIA